MKWELKTLQIEEVFENDDNPRRLTKDQEKQLRTSLEKFGVCEPVVVNRSGKIIGGHQRFSILKSMGRKTIEVYRAAEELSPAEEKELTIRLNKNTGEWDYDMLANAWDVGDLLEMGFELKELGLDEKEEETMQDVKISVTITCQDNATADNVTDAISRALDKFKDITYKTKVK